MSAEGGRDNIATMRDHVQGAQGEFQVLDGRVLLRDAVCMGALLDASADRAVGDDAELLLAESIAVIAARMWESCCNSSMEWCPPAAMHAAGQLGALARSRFNIMEEAVSAPEDRHAFLLEQVGWLDTLAGEAISKLVAAINSARDDRVEIAA